MTIIEPNYQPEPPSNQNGDREDEDFELTSKELSELYLTEVLNLVYQLLDIAFCPSIISGQTKVMRIYAHLGKLQIAYQTHLKHEIESQEI